MAACGALGYSCCPGSDDVTDTKGLCGKSGNLELGNKCVCRGFHDIKAQCADGWTGSACCGDTDCAWQDSTHTGYCQKNKCIVWEKWPLGHKCSRASDCMAGGCDDNDGCYDPNARPFHHGHFCDTNEDCLSKNCEVTIPYVTPKICQGPHP